MNDDKKQKKTKKKKNKSNRVAEEKAGERVFQEGNQGFQGTNGVASNSNSTRALESESKRESQNGDEPVDTSSVEFKDEQEPKHLKKRVHDLELYISKLEQNISELKDALQRESTDSRSLRTELALLKEQIANHVVVKAGAEEEIKRLKDENISQIQKEATMEEEIKRLKDEKASWMQKEVATEVTIKKLKDDKHSQLQKEACTEEEIQRLKDEKSSWIQKEAHREAEMQRLMNDKNSWLKIEITMEEDIKRLKNENFRLQKEVDEMKESIEKLSLERRQFTAKMAALQTGMQQLEREATVRARVEHDIAIASTPESSKRWLRWGSAKDPVALAAGIAEDSRIQKEAAAVMVEKLVTENAELMEKVNELSSTVDRLNQKCNALTESQSRQQEITEWDITALSESAFKENSTDIELMDGITVKDELSINMSNVDGTCHTKSEIEEVIVSTDPEGREHTENNLSMYDPIETSEEAKQIPSGSVRKPGEMVTQNISEEIIPLSDAPLIGAPIRLFSFFTKYVSGADLVKPKSSVAS